MHEHTELSQAYARALCGEDGRLVLADLARQGFLDETSFHPDPQRAAYNEGRRSLVLHVRRMLAEAQPARGRQPGAAPRA